MMDVGVTTGAIRCAKLQSNRHHQQTNTCSACMFMSVNIELANLAKKCFTVLPSSSLHQWQ